MSYTNQLGSVYLNNTAGAVTPGGDPTVGLTAGFGQRVDQVFAIGDQGAARDDWQDSETFVKTDPLGNPVDRRHPWNQHTNPRPQRRDFDENYSWVMSPRWFDGTDQELVPGSTVTVPPTGAAIVTVPTPAGPATGKVIGATPEVTTSQRRSDLAVAV